MSHWHSTKILKICKKNDNLIGNSKSKLPLRRLKKSTISNFFFFSGFHVIHWSLIDWLIDWLSHISSNLTVLFLKVPKGDYDFCTGKTGWIFSLFYRKPDLLSGLLGLRKYDQSIFRLKIHTRWWRFEKIRSTLAVKKYAILKKTCFQHWGRGKRKKRFFSKKIRLQNFY